jgi:hypothetical protein
MTLLQRAHEFNQDSVTVGLQLRVHAVVDSVEAVAKARAHASYDTLLTSQLAASSSYASWLGVFIGALGLLVGIGAVASGFLLWRQSSDFRKQRDELLSAARKDLDDVLAVRTREMDAQRVLVEEWRENLEVEVRSALRTETTQTAAAVPNAASEDATAGEDAGTEAPAAVPGPQAAPDPTAFDTAVGTRAYLESLERQLHQLRRMTDMLIHGAGTRMPDHSDEMAHSKLRSRSSELPFLVPRAGRNPGDVILEVARAYRASNREVGVVLELLRTIDLRLLKAGEFETAQRLFAEAVVDPRTSMSESAWTSLESAALIDSERRLSYKGAEMLRELAVCFRPASLPSGDA